MPQRGLHTILGQLVRRIWGERAELVSLEFSVVLQWNEIPCKSPLSFGPQDRQKVLGEEVCRDAPVGPEDLYSECITWFRLLPGREKASQ